MNSFFVSLPSSDGIPLTTTGNLLYKTFTAFGYKSFNAGGFPTPNTGVVYLGVVSGQLPIQIPTGQYINWTVQPNQDDSLANFWVKGGSGDGVFVIYY